MARSLAIPYSEYMAYAVQQGESLSGAASRVARELIDESLSLLEARDPQTLEEDVHQVRKNCKKLRGLLRLLRPSLGRKAYGRGNAAFRDASRELSAIRDAHALLETFDALLVNTGGGDGTLGPVREGLSEDARSASAEAANGSARLEQARARLLEGKRVVERWQLADDVGALENGLRKTYGRGRKAMRAAAKSGMDEALHEWRKRTKYTWYHLRLLQEAAPSILGPLTSCFHDLSDALGDDHDLAVLTEKLRGAPDRFGGEQAVAAALEALAPVRADLHDRAFRLGARLYVERPRAFAKRMGGYWQVWEERGAELPTGEIGDLPAARDDLGKLSVRELYEMAQELGVSRRSNMRRGKLEAAVRAAGATRPE